MANDYDRLMSTGQEAFQTQPAPAPTGGYISPGFPSPTAPPPTKMQPLPGGSGPYRPTGPIADLGGRRKLPKGFNRPGQKPSMDNAQLLGSWLHAQKGAGRPSPVRLGGANIKENPFVKTIGADAGRPRLGRGFAGGRRFQRGLGNAYGQFMKSGALQRQAPSPMPSPDFRKRIGGMVRDGAFKIPEQGGTRPLPTYQTQQGGDIRSRMMARRAEFMRQRTGR